MFLSILVGIYSCISYLMNLPKNIIFFTIFIVGVFSGFIDWKKIKALGYDFSNLLHIVTVILLILFFSLENNILVYTFFTIFLGASFASIYDYFNNLHAENEKLYNNIVKIESDLNKTETELKKSQVKLKNLHNISEEIESKRKILEQEKAQIKEKEYFLTQEKIDLQKQIRLTKSNTSEIKQLQKMLMTKSEDLEVARKQEILKSKEWEKLEKERTIAMAEINKLNKTINEYENLLIDKENSLKPLKNQDEFLTAWIDIEKLLKNKNQSNSESVKQIDLLYQQGELSFTLKNKLHNIRKRRNEVVHNKYEVPEINEYEVVEINEVVQQLRQSLFT